MSTPSIFDELRVQHASSRATQDRHAGVEATNPSTSACVTPISGGRPPLAGLHGVQGG